MEQEEQLDFPDMETEIVASAPPPEPESKPVATQKPEAETVEVSEEVKKKVLQLVKPQESKYNHFQFKSQADTDKLTNILQIIPGHNITVSYGIPQSTPDITLSENGQIVGKIHLLLCDRRDANKPEKYYVKLYFYHFIDSSLQNTVKSALVSFFESFANQQSNKNNTRTPISLEKGGKRSKNRQQITRKRKLRLKSINRKKTNKRR
jgi:hypothetical protein